MCIIEIPQPWVHATIEDAVHAQGQSVLAFNCLASSDGWITLGFEPSRGKQASVRCHRPTSQIFRGRRVTRVLRCVSPMPGGSPPLQRESHRRKG